MTDNEILQMHKVLLDTSEVVALRAIYNAGYCAGASISAGALGADQSAVAAKPSDADVAALKQKSTKSSK